MRQRKIDKHIWFSEEEFEQLVEKSEKVGLSQSAVIRSLILDYEPKEKPDEEFYKSMEEIKNMSEIIREIYRKAILFDRIDVDFIKEEANKLDAFQNKIEKRYLRPDKVKR